MSSRLCPMLAKCLSVLSFQVCREPHQQPGPQENGLPSGAAETPGQPTEQRPGCQQMAPPPADLHWDRPAAYRRATAPHRHLARTQRAHALRLARSSRWPVGERVQPGVTTALSLTLAAASLIGWQGPARGMHAGVPRSSRGAPGAYKGEFGAAGVSSHPGAELTAAP